MKNIMKIMFALLTSISLIGSVSAGELTVTGTAKATYNIISGGTAGANLSKGIGVTNDIDFGAKGELDNGWTWNYQAQLDPGDATTAGGGIDDTRLEITTGYGTLGVYITEGGLDTDNAASQSVYSRPTDSGLATGMVDGADVSGINNLQYHTPAGMLPFDSVFKVAYGTGQDATINSGNATGTSTDRFGTSAQQYQIKMTPMDGLNVGADYFTDSDVGEGTVDKVIQNLESGSAFATYSAGGATFGYSETRKAPLILSTLTSNNHATEPNNATAAGGNEDSARLYTNKKYSAAFNVNDSLSLSYEMEKSNRELIINAAEFDIKSQAVQAAYTMGGMTLAVSHGNTDNVGYANNADSTQTLFGLTMAF